MSDNEGLLYESLMNDLLFHMVFSKNNAALRGLVSSLLNLQESELQEITVLNPMQYTDAFDSKLTVLDLRAHLNGDRYLNIEMQVRRFSWWANRSLIYSCRQIVEQSNAEDFSYEKLEPVIHVAIMNHTLFRDHRRFFTKYALADREGYPYSDALQFYVMDLTAVAGATEAEKQQGLVEWANAFTAKDWEQVQQIDNPAVKEAVKQMRTIMSTPSERDIIWSRKLAEIDYRSQAAYERSEGRAEGIGIGRAEGRAEVARRMVAMGMSPADVSRFTGLSEAEVGQFGSYGNPQ